MKRPALTTLLVLAAACMTGCPVYDHEADGCYRNQDCAVGYVCDVSNGLCVLQGVPPASCARPEDCRSNETCIADGSCQVGDCTFFGGQCVTGYDCTQSNGAWACVPTGSAGAAGATGI